MKQGTVSWLLGGHSLIHSALVIIAWCKLYGIPKPWEFICIILHDIGHIGKQYLDNIEQKRQHWILGARIAKFLFGQKGFDMCAGHDAYSGYKRSKLYYADKRSWLYEPYVVSLWFQLVEPKLHVKGLSKRESFNQFHCMVKESIESGEYRSTHDIYIERMKEDNNGTKT